ncbi:hypothetical protein [Micromonospora taraxaci]|uniref:hypothetical protein n=1 Tax=Micromonospora taraxaci TaxID=1316803 RepID=UPI003F4B4A12
MEELPAYALELAADRQLSVVEVHVLPRQAERFTLAEAGDEDQGVGGVERVLVGAGRLEELSGLVARPRLAPAPADGCEVTGTAGFLAADRAVTRSLMGAAADWMVGCLHFTLEVRAAVGG